MKPFTGFILTVFTGTMFVFAFLWAHTTYFYNGLVSFNKYGEGYPEAIMFFILGVLGVIAYIKE